jgi:hypothetical protein
VSADVIESGLRTGSQPLITLSPYVWFTWFSNYISSCQYSSFKKSYELDSFMGVSGVELCHLENMAHSNVITNTIAKEFLFLNREREKEKISNVWKYHTG